MPDIAEKVVLKPVTLDDLASVRYVHGASFSFLSGPQHSEEEVQAQIDTINSKQYVDQILANNTYCAWIGDEIVGTAGWCPADDSGHTARINLVCVRPLFHNMGIGRLLIRDAENRAKNAGFFDFSVRSNINAVSFYQRHGYSISSHGIMHTRMKIDLPVAFMRKYGIPVNQNIPVSIPEQIGQTVRQPEFMRA